MTATLASAEAVVQAALAGLPITDPLEAGQPVTEPVAFDGVAVTARFTGNPGGDVLIAVERALAEALQNSPLGSLDVAAALAPALAAAAGVPQGRGGRLDVLEDLTVDGFPGVYAAGDV
ncbi:MAG TPA: hypothetical protein VFU36_16125, partial [Jatrophihabitans sp.]|nr:hypothetical protein [Jatrophihabitans sp.]